MSESNSKVIELEAERDELRARVAKLELQVFEMRMRKDGENSAIAEVEARALEHAALEFKAQETVWVRAQLLRMAMLKRAGSLP